MKKSVFFAVIIAAMSFVSCETNNSVSPSAKKTTLWLAYSPTNHAWGYIEKSGKWGILPTYQNALPFSCGMAKVQQDKSIFFIDESGEMVEGSMQPASYDLDHGFVYDFLRFREGNMYGMMDKSFNTILPAQFHQLGQMTSNGLVFAQKNNGDLFGYYDKEGNEVIAPRFKQADDFIDGYATVKEGFVYYVINTIGDTLWNSSTNPLSNLGSKRFVMPVSYDQVSYGLFNEKGERVSENSFHNLVTDFYDGLAGVMGDNNKLGYINTSGDWEIEPKYYGSHNFSDGVAWVQESLAGEWILINKSGAVQFRLEAGLWPVGSYENGLCSIMKKSVPVEYLYIDKKGKVIYFWNDSNGGIND